MSRRRPTNDEVASDAFRDFLRDGFYAIDDDGVILEGADEQSALSLTAPWRAELLRRFQAIEDRLCPVRVFERHATCPSLRRPSATTR